MRRLSLHIKVFLVAVALILGSCRGVMDALPVEFNSQRLLELLSSAERANVTIDSVRLLKGEERFSLSNKSTINIPVTYAPIVRIGEDGFWYENDVKTAFKWGRGGEDDPLIHLRSIKTYEVDKKIDESDLFFVGAKESLTNFSFYFSNGECVTLSKSLFVQDLDKVMKTINHRGFRTVAPENTLESYRLARFNGFRYVETDIRFSKDNIPVLIHDESINRTSNGNGNVAEMTFEELRRYDYGSWKSKRYEGASIPSLEEFLILCEEIGLFPYLELKVGTKDQIFSVVSLVQQYGLQDNVTYISYSNYLLNYVMDCYPDARLGVLANKIDESTIRRADQLKTAMNHVEILSSDKSDSAVSLCSRSGYDLYVGSIDDPKAVYNLPKSIAGMTSNSIHAGWVLLNRK